MREKPLERLNYFSGQRLEAGDFRLEQDYHIRVQQWLMRSLFTPGVARGLDISVEERQDKAPDGKPITVHVAVVQPGVALDDLGRAIILIEPRELAVHGEFLTARYDERKLAPQQDGCVLPSHVKGASVHPTWGGPSRILAEPIFAWRSRIPADDTLELVLAQFELDEHCRVKKTLSGARRYATASPVARVYSFALEGEKDIDKNNSKTIYFHVRGRRPEAVTLYLRAAKFSSLYYTELGKHRHGSTIETGVLTEAAGAVPKHKHSLPEMTTVGNNNPDLHPANHGHTIRAWISPPDIPVIKGALGILPRTVPGSLLATSAYKYLGIEGVVDAKVGPDGAHDHTIAVGVVTTEEPEIPAHQHKVVATVTSAGVNDIDARTGETQKALAYLKNLKVLIDNVPQTEAIRRQVERLRPMEDWAMLGNGKGEQADPLVANGTGPIRLDFLPQADFSPGDHVIELSVEGDGNGGCILYNLYVE